ncbi:MAG: response regulator [Armatimonadetes bacterium]|nr:response regulator [Armatimonadota bacterium]
MGSEVIYGQGERRMAGEMRSGQKILIIDDNEAVVTTLRVLLEREGFEVVSGCTCREGMLLAAENSPDIILLDWILPDGEGPTLISTLKELCSAPCIMITAQDTHRHCVEALEAGCDDFVSKPIRPHELLLRVNRLLKIRYGDSEAKGGQ